MNEIVGNILLVLGVMSAAGAVTLSFYLIYFIIRGLYSK